MTTGKMIALLGGGYLLYETGLLSSLTGGLIPAPTATPTTTTPGGTVSTGGGQPVNNTAPPPAAPPPTKALVLQASTAAKDPALQTFDSWNFRFQQVRGVAGPDPSVYLPAATRGENLSIDEWWAYMQKAGFSGLGRFGKYARQFSGLGCAGCAGESAGGYVSSGVGRWIY